MFAPGSSARLRHHTPVRLLQWSLARLTHGARGDRERWRCSASCRVDLFVRCTREGWLIVPCGRFCADQVAYAGTCRRSNSTVLSSGPWLLSSARKWISLDSRSARCKWTGRHLLRRLRGRTSTSSMYSRPAALACPGKAPGQQCCYITSAQ